MPITANYTPAQFKLSVIGTLVAELMTVSRNASGQLLVNGGSVPITGGTPTVANTSLIEMLGDDGDDTITLDEANGALPAAELLGGGGADTITGGSAGDTLIGQAGDDTLLGKGGIDLLYGGIDNDTLTGGDGDDQMFGEDGNDRLIWNPGDDSDLMEGGNGSDTVEVNGGNGDESFTITANGTRVRFDRVTPAPFALDIGTSEALVLNANGGNDTISTSGNLAALISLTIDGGAGNDTILGGNGIDTLLGGDGDDFVDGNQGADVAFLGAGSDIFNWDPGDGSDVVEGQADSDQLLFNGSAANETFDINANGARAMLLRNVGAITIDANDIETFTLNALGGTDLINVNNLAGTDVTQVAVNLSGTIGGTAGDGAADTVTVAGTGGGDAVTVTGAGTAFTVTGLPASVVVSNAEGANDTLTLNALGGDDGITATTLPAGVAKLVVDGGTGNDTILAGQGSDVIFGGDGDDFVLGDNGNDTAFLGIGNDVFEWSPGDGSDIVEGQANLDELRFNGSNANETVNVSANGGRAVFTRDVAAVTMDLDDVERITFNAVGGSDTLVVSDLSGTDVANVVVHLEAVGGGGDGAVDNVTATGVNAAETITLNSAAGVMSVSGLSATVTVFGAEAANDRLTVNAVSGDDVVNASTLASGILSLTVNGGLGNDLFFGSGGNDTFNGGDGNDTSLLGAGDDVAVWNPGDDNDIIEGQAGTDRLNFNGANVAETITISPNGGRVLFQRDVAAVTMDLNGTEAIQFIAVGGTDAITVNDLSGTDVTQLDIDLAATPGGAAGDGAVDTLNLNAGGGDNTIALSGATGALLTVTGLPANAAISQFETTDRLSILANDGDDTISATGLTPHFTTLTINGGEGNDVIRSNGDGTYLGGGGDDTVFAGLTGSQEVLNGGDGVDTLDTTSFGGTYSVNLATGVTNFASESFTNFENIVTGAGSDTITGTAGANVIATGDNTDALSGADGADWLQGGGDSDTGVGGTGHDSVWGGSGDDVLDGGEGDDTIVGDEGFDTVSYGGASSGVEIDLSWPEEQDTRGAGWDTLISIESVIGSGFADVLRGNPGANRLIGGGAGDTLAAGDGDDMFTFLSLADSLPGSSDKIFDFQPGKDRIDLSPIDADAVSAGNQAFHLGATAGHTGDIVLAYDASSDTTSVSLFVNADAVADALIRMAGNHLGLGAADFAL
jgi:Ca2+-binding RTX toxin-like protein